jgi:hypothetical protein
MVSEMSRQFRHLSVIREQALRREAATQGTRPNRGEAGCHFEQNCRNARHLSNHVSRPRQPQVLAGLLPLRKLRSLKLLTIAQADGNFGIPHALS